MRIFPHGSDCGHSCCLRVENLSVIIGGDKILQDVNLHVHCGQMVALIGPNGAGKSTLLKTILGEREYKGVIAFPSPVSEAKNPGSAMFPRAPTLTQATPFPSPTSLPAA